MWQKVDGFSKIHNLAYTEQPRHYTLAVARNPVDVGRALSVSIKRDGVVSGLLHDSPEGTKYDLSAPYGCFELSGAEDLWLADDA